MFDAEQSRESNCHAGFLERLSARRFRQRFPGLGSASGEIPELTVLGLVDEQEAIPLANDNQGEVPGWNGLSRHV